MAVSLIRNDSIDLRAANGSVVEHFSHASVTGLPLRADQVSAEWDEPAPGDPIVSGFELALRADPIAAREGHDRFTSLIGGGSRTFRKTT